MGDKMNKITNKKILILFTLFSLILPTFYDIVSVFLKNFGVTSNNINSAMILYMSIPFLIFVYIYDLVKNKRKLDIFDYIFYALVISGIISTIFSIDKVIALFGENLRYEGLLTVTCYYLLFINWKVNGTKEDINRFLKLLLIIGLVNAIYSFFQVYTSYNFILRFGGSPNFAIGFLGHHNFFGTLMVTVISIVFMKILIDKKITFKNFLMIVIFLIALINCQSTGPYLAFVLTSLFSLIYISIKFRWRIKRVIIYCSIILAVLLISFYSINITNKYINNDSHCEICNINETINTGGTYRLDIWKNSLEIVKKNFITGVGFDNFYLAYPNNPKVDNTVTVFIDENGVVQQKKEDYVIIDNAHNVYLQMLVSTGILGLIPYLLLFLSVLQKGLKSKNKLKMILLSGFVAYSLQAFFNINIVQITPIYYTIIGLILSKDEPKETSYIY